MRGVNESGGHAWVFARSATQGSSGIHAIRRNIRRSGELILGATRKGFDHVPALRICCVPRSCFRLRPTSERRDRPTRQERWRTSCRPGGAASCAARRSAKARAATRSGRTTTVRAASRRSLGSAATACRRTGAFSPYFSTAPAASGCTAAAASGRAAASARCDTCSESIAAATRGDAVRTPANRHAAW
jgi:hypothetical protein